MLLSRKEVNVWPAFSDLMFMLAICSMVIAAAVVGVTRRKEQSLQKQEQELKKSQATLAELKRRLVAIGINPDDRQECGLATPVVQKMEDCLLSQGVSAQRHGCGLAVEGAIQFAYGSTTLSDEGRTMATRVAHCVIEGAREVVRLETATMNHAGAARPGDKDLSFGLDAISIEGHADRCGYEDWKTVQERGMEKPSLRAKRVYDLVFEGLTSDAEISPAERTAILARIATRSFGPYRPLTGSTCDCSDANRCQSDRRVEIVVQGRIGNNKPNWVAVEGLHFKPRRHASRVDAALVPSDPTLPAGATGGEEIQ